MTDRDIFLIEVARRGRDGDYAGASEVAALDSRATALEARPHITNLDAVPDVAAPSPGSGQFLMWNGSAWVPTSLNPGIQMYDGSAWIGPYPRVLILPPLTYALDSLQPEMVKLGLTLGTSGSSGVPAREDHTHTTPVGVSQPITPGGYMSSGTRSLTAYDVYLAPGVTYRVKATVNLQMRGADPGACYYQLRVTINGNAKTSGAGANGFWCVQGVPDKTSFTHYREITGTGTTVTVSTDVLYHSGGGFYTDAGSLDIELDSNR